MVMFARSWTAPAAAACPAARRQGRNAIVLPLYYVQQVFEQTVFDIHLKDCSS